MKRFPIVGACVALAVFAAIGCRGGRVSFHFDRHGPRVVREHVYVADTHVCSHDCRDHYWDGYRVVVISGGHHHGPECGHYWNGGHWVVGRTRTVHLDHGHAGTRTVHLKTGKGKSRPAIKVKKPHGGSHH